MSISTLKNTKTPKTKISYAQKTIMYAIALATIISVFCVTVVFTVNGRMKDKPIFLEEEKTPFKYDNGGTFFIPFSGKQKSNPFKYIKLKIIIILFI